MSTLTVTRQSRVYRPLFIKGTNVQIHNIAFYSVKDGVYCESDSGILEGKIGYTLNDESITRKEDIFGIYDLSMRKAIKVDSNLKKGGCFYHVGKPRAYIIDKNYVTLYIDVAELMDFEFLPDHEVSRFEDRINYGNVVRFQQKMDFAHSFLNDQKQLEYTQKTDVIRFEGIIGRFTRHELTAKGEQIKSIKEAFINAGLDIGEHEVKRLIKSPAKAKELIKQLKTIKNEA